MKKYLMMFSVLFCLSATAHDEGHGPALKDESHYGGKVTGIINKKEVSIGRKAKLIYKAELVHSSKNTEVKVYLYDKDMKPMTLEKFKESANAVQLERKSEKKFALKMDKSKKFFMGKRPKNRRVPFNIDVVLSDGKTEYFGAFDGLD